MKHQITLVGGQLLPIYVGIKEFNPDHIHFVVSPESKDKIQLLRSFLTGKKASEHLCNPFDFHSVHLVCKKILENCREGDQIQFNLTGGTKIMVLAAQSLMLENNIQGCYINQTDTFLTLPGFIQNPLKSEITIDEFFELSGHKLSSFNSLKDFTKDDINASNTIENFALQNDNNYFKISTFLNKKWRNLKDVPVSGNEKINDKIILKWTGNNIELNIGGVVALKINSKNSRYLFFNCGWWELKVAESISKWGKAKELFLQCELPFKSDKTNTKNEIDILINLGRQMIFIECKSGNVKQEDINKMKIVKDTYGGIISKSILVSRFVLQPGILEKCKELGIEVFYTMMGRNQVNKLSNLEKTLEKLSKQLSVN